MCSLFESISICGCLRFLHKINKVSNNNLRARSAAAAAAAAATACCSIYKLLGRPAAAAEAVVME